MNLTRVHTSDRANFRRCRRRWDWTSPLRKNLRPKSESIIHFWFGNGIHYALEDYYGYNRFGTPDKALIAFYDAHVKGKIPLPEEADEHIEKGVHMLEHFLDWQSSQMQFETIWIDGVPQVEAHHEVHLFDETDDRHGVVYDMRLDRVMRDTHGRTWLCDYKTAAQFDTNKLENDSQVTSYLLFASHIYDVEFEGMVYLQLKKDYPKPPQRLVNGGLSMNKNQNTTRALYLKELREMYGNKVPVKYAEFLKVLKANETDEGDKFIKRTYVRRSPNALQAEYEKILMELDDMLYADLPLYPNPTRDCSWDCSVRSPCLIKDDGGDYEQVLKENYVTKQDEPDWRKFLVYPETL